MRDLRVRLGVILALALLPLLVFSIWRSYFDFTRDQALLRNNADLTARFALNDIVNSFDNTQAILQFTSTLLAGEDCKSNLTRVTDSYPRFHNIIEVDAQGTVKCSAKPVRPTLEQRLSLLNEISETSPFSTEVYTFPSPDGGSTRVVASAYGVFEAGALVEAFVVVEDIDILLQRIARSEQLDGNEVAMFTKFGEKLGGDWNGDDLQAIAQIFPAKNLETKLSTIDQAGRKILVVPTPSKEIFIGVATDRTTLRAANNFNPVTYAIIPLLAWLFGFVAIWLATDKLILIHIRKMRRATIRFAQGDRSARVGTLKDPPASLYALGQNFDLMANKIVEREAMIGDSLDEKETLLREIHHRVKNNLQIITSLLNMQERKLTDKAGLAAIIETRSRINALALVHRGLYESTDLRFVDMNTFLERLLPELGVALGLKAQGITVSSHADCDPMEADTATPVALFIVEVLTNSVRRGMRSGETVAITILQTGQDVVVSVNDTSLKADAEDGSNKSHGTKLLKGFARQLGGIFTSQTGPSGHENTLNFTPRTPKNLTP